MTTEEFLALFRYERDALLAEYMRKHFSSNPVPIRIQKMAGDLLRAEAEHIAGRRFFDLVIRASWTYEHGTAIAFLDTGRDEREVARCGFLSPENYKNWQPYMDLQAQIEAQIARLREARDEIGSATERCEAEGQRLAELVERTRKVPNG